MSGTVRLSDGTVGYYARRGDDCWPSAAATVLQIPVGELPDLHLDRWLLGGMSVEDIDRNAKSEVQRFLTGRGLKLVAHGRLPVHLPRWLGVVPFDGWFVSHCLCMSFGRVLFDPTPPVPPVELAILEWQSPIPVAPVVWRAGDVGEGFSFEPLYPSTKGV